MGWDGDQTQCTKGVERFVADLSLLSLSLCKSELAHIRVYISLSVTHILSVFDVQSGRFMHCCFACSLHQWLLHTFSLRTQIRFGSYQWGKIKEDQRLVFLEVPPHLLRIIVGGTWTYRKRLCKSMTHFLFFFLKSCCIFLFFVFFWFCLTITLLILQFNSFCCFGVLNSLWFHNWFDSLLRIITSEFFLKCWREL